MYMGHIRMAQGSDALELLKLNDLFNGKGSNTLAGIKESLQTNTTEVVCVAVDDDHLVGFCCGQIYLSMCYSSPYAEITELFVEDEHRRQGVGRLLLTFMEGELAKRGVYHLHILTFKDNHAARSLYRSLGYVETLEMLLDKDQAVKGEP